ncbi:MAG: DUF1566 domain-containing protein [Nitrospirae bacterium]|nr:DUF1566 domain-containing protein [Nitrospirota bacterium]
MTKDLFIELNISGGFDPNERALKMEEDMEIFRKLFGSRKKSGLEGEVIGGKNQPKAVNIIAYGKNQTVDSDGIIAATGTGLQWYFGPDETWYNANSWVKSLSVGGGGWRMPTRAELIGLNDDLKVKQGITDYGMSISGWVWSGELKVPSAAWFYVFGIDVVNYCDRSSTMRVFAVRSR